MIKNKTANQERLVYILQAVQSAVTADDINKARHHCLWLMDTLFPTGFVYTVNHGPGEPEVNDEQ